VIYFSFDEVTDMYYINVCLCEFANLYYEYMCIWLTCLCIVEKSARYVVKCKCALCV
jgi:hypothetical protein